MLATLQLAYVLLQSSPSQEAIVASLGKHNTMTLSSFKMLDVTKSRVVSVQGLSEITDVFASADLERVVVFTGDEHLKRRVYLLLSNERLSIELRKPQELLAYDARVVGSQVHVLYSRENGVLESHTYDLSGNPVGTSIAKDRESLTESGVFAKNLLAKRDSWRYAEEYTEYYAREWSGIWQWHRVFGLASTGTFMGNFSPDAGRWIVISQSEGRPYRYKIGGVSKQLVRTVDFKSHMKAFDIRKSDIVALSTGGQVIVISHQGKVLASSNEGFADFLCGQLEGE